MTWYPLTFRPVFKDYPWGGRALATRLGRAIPDGIVAESWDVAAHPNGTSVIAQGPLAGMSLRDLMAQTGEALVGTRHRAAVAAGRFPLLIKILDANRWLSVQVHPDDAYALAHEGEWGKTEMWVVLHAEPGAELIYGFAKPVDRASFAAAITAGEIEPWLHRVAVKNGDTIFVPTGTIHALGPGIMVAEIQQNSDTTYRIYDWGRPRPIHLEQSLDVLNYAQVQPTLPPPTVVAHAPAPTEVIGDCAYFHMERLRPAAGQAVDGATTGETLEIWGVIDGAVRVEWERAPRAEGIRLAAVDWVLIPATLGEFRVVAERESVLLRVTTPPADQDGEQAVHG